MMISGEGKTIYTDAKSLSDDFERRIEDGDEDVIPRLEEIAKAEDPEQPHSRARALYELAQIYFKGLCDVEKSSEKGLEYLNQAANFNDDLALLTLGDFYLNGEHELKKDVRKALEYFQKAADKGNRQGLKYAAHIFRFDEGGIGGVKADGYKVLEFYERLVALDDKRTSFEMAELYKQGCGRLKADGYKALEIYEEIISCGKYWLEVFQNFNIRSPRFEDMVTAMREAANIYLEGSAGVIPDGQKAIEYLDKVIELDDDQFYDGEAALKDVVSIYLEGKAGIAPDGYKAIEYYQKVLIDNPNRPPYYREEALECVAEIYCDGTAGVIPDGEKAIEYFEKFIKLTYRQRADDAARALYRIAKIYLNGNAGIEPNGKKAVKYFEKVLKLSSAENMSHYIIEDARLEIAKIYDKGLAGVKSNLPQAWFWYKKCAENGNDEAQRRLEELPDTLEEEWKVAERAKVKKHYARGLITKEERDAKLAELV